MIFSELQSHESYRYQRWSKCKLAVAQILLVAIFSVFAVSEIDTAYGAEPPMFPPLVPHVPPKAETLNKGNLVSKIGIQTLFLHHQQVPLIPLVLLLFELHQLFVDDNFLKQKLNYYPFYLIYDLIP